ncbi:MAG TPA: FHA domain-containing protein [Acidobacteriota bacterium]|jgi:hypothetical protein
MEQQQATAREIILAIIENLHTGLEPLLYKTLVPSIFDVYLHLNDYERLEGIWPKVVEEARSALDKELQRLNQATEPPKLFKMLPIFEKDEMKYERAESEWYITLYKNTDEDANKGDIVIDSRLTLPAAQKYGAGAKTKRIVTMRSGGETRMLRKVYQETDRQSGGTPSPEDTANALAKISYEDDHGKQVYMMKKNQIVVGRGGVDYWVDLQLFSTPDVSREHLRLRRDDDNGQFFIKDLSKFGTTVDGKKIPSSVEVAGDDRQDKDLWFPLPPKARIGLAEVIFLEFQAI